MNDNTNNNKNNKQRKRSHLALNCTIGALALLGSVGTITFGTLWCQSRNNGGGDTPTDEPLVINLDEVDDRDEYSCLLQKNDLSVKKGQKIALISEMSNVPQKYKGEGSHLDEYRVTIASAEKAPIFNYDCELYVDDNLICPDFYSFGPTPMFDNCNLLWTISEDYPLPETFNMDTSVFKVIITPYTDISTDITFLSTLKFGSL